MSQTTIYENGAPTSVYSGGKYTPIAAPAAPAAPAATPASAYKGLNVGQGDGSDATIASFLDTAKTGASAAIPDESTVYQDKLRQYQGEIDANNKIYADQLSKAATQGISDLGSGRAIQARSGLLGSDFAGAQNDKITENTNATERAIQAEQSAKLAAIMGTARKDAVDAVAAKRAAQQQSTQDYITYLGASDARKTTNTNKVAQALVAQGLKFSDVDPAQIASLAKSYGIAPGDIETAYNTAAKAAADAKAAKDEQAIKDRSFNLSEGQSYYQYNPATGKTELVASKAKTYAPTAATAGGGAYTEGADPVVDSWIKAVNAGTAKITNVPANIRNTVVQGLGGDTAKSSELKQTAADTAQQLLDKFDKGEAGYGVVGIGGDVPTIPGTKGRDFSQNLDALKSLLSLDNVKYLKGQGQISDAERKLLADSATQLSRGQSPAQFRETLSTLVQTLKPAAAAAPATDGGSPQKGTDGAAYGFPGYHSDGTQWVPN